MKYVMLLACTVAFLTLDAQDHLVESGNREMNDGNYRMAQDYYQAALAKEPQNWNLHTLLGFCYHKQKLYTLADSMFRISTMNDSVSSKGFWYKGLNHLAMRQDSMSIISFKKFISLEKNRSGSLVQAYRYIGQSYERMLKRDGLYSWQVDDMIFHYEQIERTDPSYVEVPLIRQFLELVKAQRPANQVGKWKMES